MELKPLRQRKHFIENFHQTYQQHRALQQFGDSSRREKYRTIYNDWGSNFLGVNQQLQKEYREALQTSGEELANDCREWKFIPPGSPDFGGLWEASVKSIKRQLYKKIRLQLLNVEEFNTLLAEIKACLNSWPLTEIISNPPDVTTLTPGHFHTKDNLFELRSGPNETSKTLIEKWKLIQSMKRSF